MTLEESLTILKRNDYVRVSNQLRDKLRAIAKNIRVKMEDLDMDLIQCGHIYHIRSVFSRRLNYSEEFLFMTDENIDTYNIEADNFFYIGGDYSAPVRPCTNNRVFLKFAKDLPALFAKLDEIEKNLVSDVEKCEKIVKDFEI